MANMALSQGYSAPPTPSIIPMTALQFGYLSHSCCPLDLTYLTISGLRSEWGNRHSATKPLRVSFEAWPICLFSWIPTWLNTPQSESACHEPRPVGHCRSSRTAAATIPAYLWNHQWNGVHTSVMVHNRHPDVSKTSSVPQIGGRSRISAKTIKNAKTRFGAKTFFLNQHRKFPMLGCIKKKLLK